MTNLDNAWRDLQRTTLTTETAVLQQMAEVQRLRTALLAAIKKLELMLEPH